MGGRSTPRSGPQERQREARRGEEVEEEKGWSCGGSAAEGARWAWRPGTGAGEEGR